MFCAPSEVRYLMPSYLPGSFELVASAMYSHLNGDFSDVYPKKFSAETAKPCDNNRVHDDGYKSSIEWSSSRPDQAVDRQRDVVKTEAVVLDNLY